MHRTTFHYKYYAIISEFLQPSRNSTNSLLRIQQTNSQSCSIASCLWCIQINYEVLLSHKQLFLSFYSRFGPARPSSGNSREIYKWWQKSYKTTMLVYICPLNQVGLNLILYPKYYLHEFSKTSCQMWMLFLIWSTQIQPTRTMFFISEEMLLTEKLNKYHNFWRMKAKRSTEIIKYRDNITWKEQAADVDQRLKFLCQSLFWASQSRPESPAHISSEPFNLSTIILLHTTRPVQLIQLCWIT
jgi:hypothetical protein